jgi:hypothetical protein
MGRYVCKTCGEEKDASKFRVKEKRLLKSGVKAYRSCHCSVCDDMHKKRYSNKNPHFWIANRYNISKEEALKWYKESMTFCYICGKEWQEGNEKLCIDHDHNTQEIRGILCRHCNHLLGHAFDKVEILESAQQYLKRAGG